MLAALVVETVVAAAAVPDFLGAARSLRRRDGNRRRHGCGKTRGKSGEIRGSVLGTVDRGGKCCDALVYRETSSAST